MTPKQADEALRRLLEAYACARKVADHLALKKEEKLYHDIECALFGIIDAMQLIRNTIKTN